MCINGKKGKVTCSAFYNYFNGKTEENLSQWKCTSEGRNHNYETQNEQHTRLQQQKDQRINTQQRHAVVNTDNNGRRLHDYLDQYANISSDIQDLKQKQLEDFDSLTENQQLSSIIDISSSPSGSNAKSMIIPPLAIVMGVFSIIMCRFTLVGYWLKKALIGKSKRKRNIIMDRNIIEDYTIHADLDSPRRFNVRYSNIY